MNAVMYMVTYRNARKAKLPTEEAAPQPYLFQTPETTAMLERMWQKYKRYAVPLEDLQAELDQALGSRSLTEELCKMRGK